MVIKKTLKAIFNIEPGEGKLVGISLLQSVFLGFPRLFTITVAGALFLENYSADNLPYAYIGAALLLFSSGFIYLNVEKRTSFIRLMSGTLLMLCLALSGLILMVLWFPDKSWLSLALVIWYYVEWILSNLVYWSVANRLFTIRQAKRLFGFIRTGEVLTVGMGGLLMPYLVRFLGTPNLLFFSLGGLLLAFANLTYIEHAFKSKFVMESAQPDNTTSERTTSLVSLFQNRYLVLIFAFYVCFACITYYFVDNIFYYQVKQQYPDSDQLAGFIGQFLGVCGLLSLFFQSFISGRWMMRFGLLGGMLTMPIGLGICTVFVVITGNLLNMTELLFGLIVLMKLFERVINISVAYPVYYTLYQPLPPGQRTRVQMTTESIVGPISTILISAALLLNKYFELTSVGLSGVLLVFLMSWCFLIPLTNGEYRKALVIALKSRGLIGAGLSLSDVESLQILERGLQSHRPREVLYCLKLLEDAKYPTGTTLLFNLVGHTDPEVREGVYQSIERSGQDDFFECLQKRLPEEETPQARAALLRALAATGEVEALDIITPYLDALHLEVQGAAIVALIRYCGLEGAVSGGCVLIGLRQSPKARERELAARILGHIGISNFYRGLLPLLRDEDLDVRKAALTAANQLNNCKLWPLVVENLKLLSVKEIAANVLFNAGESAFPDLETVYAQERHSLKLRRQIIRLYGKMKSREAITLLLKKLDETDRNLLDEILWALHLCDYQAIEHKENIDIEQLLQNEFSYAVQVLEAQSLLEGTQQDFLLSAALDHEVQKIRTRIFLLLSFMYPSETIMKIQSNFNDDQADKRDMAIELLDTTVNTAHKTLIKLLLKVGSQEIRSNSESSSELFECLQNMIFQPWMWNNSWGRACAIDCAATLLPLDLHKSFALLLNDQDDLIQETVRSILDLSSATSILEKVKILRAVRIFSEIPDEILAEVAAILEEIKVGAKEEVIRKGEFGTSMYIIAHGLIRVHNEEVVFAELNRGDIFGELAALDTEPRTASVTTVSDSHLFRLPQWELRVLMSGRIEVARSIIHFLYNCLRSFPRKRIANQNTVTYTPSSGKKFLRRRQDYPLSLIEKVIILKTVSIFSNTPDNILSEIAGLTREVFLEQDKVLFQKGDLATSMYIIVDGRVRVFDEERVIVELGARETLGELTALFSEPQTVSVAALEDTRLLSLTQESLFELMLDQHEIVQGIIRVLVQRLRNLRT